VLGGQDVVLGVEEDASEDLTRAMLRAKIKPSVRAEALSLEQNAKLFLALTRPAVAQVS